MQAMIIAHVATELPIQAVVENEWVAEALTELDAISLGDGGIALGLDCDDELSAVSLSAVWIEWIEGRRSERAPRLPAASC
jgi:hypothetical protein